MHGSTRAAARRYGARVRVAPLALAIALCCHAAARAATIAVNDPSEGSVAGKCTLEDAVAAINTAAPKNACPAGDGADDTVDLGFFTSPTTLTFTLPSPADPNSALALSKPATIRAGVDASGNPLVSLARSTVSGTPAFRLLSTSADLSLRGVAMRNGISPDLGGALNASGSAALTITNSTFSGNTAGASGGAIAADCGDITLSHATVSGNSATKNGGGVYASNYLVGGGHCVSVITLASSKVTGNQTATGSGGGVYSFYGNVYATFSTFDSNHAGGDRGGGVYAYINASLYYSTVSNNSSSVGAGGVGAANEIYLGNSTVAGNYSIGATAGLEAFRVSIFFSTITGNTVGPQNYPLGGMAFLASAYIVGSIVAGNAGGQIIGEASVQGHNNIFGSNGPGQSITLPPDSMNCNPLLAPLADNGGPTKTMALMDGSCALNRGPAFAPDFHSDQRGARFARRVGSATDIGAFESGNDRIFFDGFSGLP